MYAPSFTSPHNPPPHATIKGSPIIAALTLKDTARRPPVAMAPPHGGCGVAQNTSPNQYLHDVTLQLIDSQEESFWGEVASFTSGNKK